MRPNQIWAIDFVFDTLADGRTPKCLTVVEDWTRECLAIDVGSGIRAARVVEVLGRLVSLRGAPRFLRSDNGPEFISRALLRWINAEGIQTAFIDPGNTLAKRGQREFQRPLSEQARHRSHSTT